MSPRYKYSYQFGYDVVIQLTEKYARGTRFIARMSGIDVVELKSRLIGAIRTGNQVNWEAYKLMIKHSEAEEFVEYKGISLTDRRAYLTYVKYCAQDRVLDGKTAGLSYNKQDNLLT